MTWLILFIFIFIYLNLLLLIFSLYNINMCKNIKLKFFDVSFYFKDISALTSLAFMTFRSYRLLQMSGTDVLYLVNAQEIKKLGSIVIVKYTFLNVVRMFTSMQIKAVTGQSLLFAIISIFVMLFILKYTYRKVRSVSIVFITSLICVLLMCKMPYTFTIGILSCFIQSSLYTILCCYMLSKMIQMLDLLWSTVSSFLYTRKDD